MKPNVKKLVQAINRAASNSGLEINVIADGETYMLIPVQDWASILVLKNIVEDEKEEK